MITAMYAAKRQIFDRFIEAAGREGTALHRHLAQVSYDWPGSGAEAVCVYGGGTSFEQPDDEALSDGRAVLITEVDNISVHVRAKAVPRPADGARTSDRTVEEIGAELARLLFADPNLGGGLKIAEIRIPSGQGDYAPDNDTEAISTLSLTIAVTSVFDPMEP